MQELIEKAFDDGIDAVDAAELKQAVAEAIDLLDSGKARVAEPCGDSWQVNQWLKKAVLISFRMRDNEVIDAGYTRFYDKVAMKYADYTA
ncbi:MAG: 2,3,4,5-tetrahydropyridine-2,6-dicarboxylate N-succinyltransferase, partial [Proteobacteria bacterium]|nr:2,3,4,5-tetrahydropyridine-2,6-dicarboxylate N-succinyltransferase [Pseudomonadota bacterium]